MTDLEVEDFKKHIIESRILDPEGVHHEFVSGMHGRKLDFDAIPDNSPLFQEWTNIVADFIKATYPDINLSKTAILSVANGTNRLVGPVAEKLGGGVVALLTEKVSPKEVKLTNEAIEKLKALQPDIVISVEDVGTKGTTSATAIKSARAAGAKRVEAINTWQRRNRLEELEAINAVNHSIILEELPTYTAEECRADGYCAKGWKYIEHA